MSDLCENHDLPTYYPSAKNCALDVATLLRGVNYVEQQLHHWLMLEQRDKTEMQFLSRDDHGSQTLDALKDVDEV